MSLVSNLQLLSKERGITIPMLEKELGFGRGSLYKWDSNSPSVDKVQKVAEYFGVKVDDLLAGETANKTPKILKPITQLMFDFSRYSLRVEILDGPFFKSAIISHAEHGELFNMSVADFQESGELLLEDLVKEFNLSYEPETIAAHHDGEDWTEEELQDLEEFKEILKLKRQLKKNKE